MGRVVGRQQRHRALDGRIGAWVALWRPIEIFLYDWWPIRAEARLFDRLSQMEVRTVSAPPGKRDDVDESKT